jgi:1-acyl-sn-glycerol-3-phosphate acyltransferase
MGPIARAVHWLLVQCYVRGGWRPEGKLPDDRKMVIMGASHTSNWDFIVFLGTIDAVGRQARFIGKHSLFKGAMGRFMRSLGGVPVDRSSPQDLVGQIVARMEASEDFLLVIAPEGTRSRTTDWRSGFYQIALRAGVPIVCAGPDYARKRGVFGPVIRPTGDMAADLKPAFEFFRTLRPRHPERAAFPDQA